MLELVEGTTLADRIAKGPIPLDEALPIAKQIAEALEAAHEAGVIHRDLKPANIKVREDGTVKVLDLGLAWGRLAYMSPEQARGMVVDRRADIWSFGVVLYEMLTGTRLFEGATVSDTLAAVLRREEPTGGRSRSRRPTRCAGCGGGLSRGSPGGVCRRSAMPGSKSTSRERRRV